MAVVIKEVEKRSTAKKHGLKPYDVLQRINGHEVNDILDFLFYSIQETVELEFLRNGKLKNLSIKKEEHQDIGLVFEDFLMDNERKCENKCIFCFIDQLPKGLREPLYIKDDDERLSFLFGNYLSLTNLSDEHISRIIEFNINPINISVHTTNAKLRNYMMGNPLAGEALDKLNKLANAGIKLNCQIVLCKGINDNRELESTLHDLINLYPSVLSISVVPVGLSAYRDGLTELEPFDKESAIATLSIIEEQYLKCRSKYEVGIVYPADEWFILSEKPIPDISYYDELHQLENGVGMLALLKSEFFEAIERCEEFLAIPVDVITGEAAYSWIYTLLEHAKKKYPQLCFKVHCIKNNFFGGNVVVAGLLTARDIMSQLSPEEIQGERILIPCSMLRDASDMFLDDVSLDEFSSHFKKEVVVISNGEELFNALNRIEKGAGCE